MPYALINWIFMFLLLPLPSIYSGHQSILVPPLELESNVSLWLSAVSQYKVRVTFCSYSVMEMCTKGLGTQTDVLRVSGLRFSTYRHKHTCVFLKRLHFGLEKMSFKVFLWEPSIMTWFLGSVETAERVSFHVSGRGKKKKSSIFSFSYLCNLCAAGCFWDFGQNI